MAFLLADIAMTDLAHPYTPSIQHAIYKASPQDFIVHEMLNLVFSETGEHLWLKVQKTNLNTAFVAKLLAKWAKITVKDVGYSGLKDRHAVTTQWFSLRLPTKQSPTDNLNDFLANQLAQNETITVLEQHWHNKKLGRGTHQANQFIITLREVKGDKPAIESQLAQITTHGVPNYFGEQRFGKDGNNIEQVVELFEKNTLNGKKINRKFDQDKISILLSSARSELFNAILAKRIELGIWDKAILGDVMNLAGSNSVFVPTAIDDDILQRLQIGDIHLTAPLWGDGELKSFGEIAELENHVIRDNELYQKLAQGLIQFGLKQQRRAMRLLPQEMTWQWLDDSTLQLTFTLPTGSFATSVLAAISEHLQTTR